MKKITIILLCLLGGFVTISCEDTSEKITYNAPTEFVLNTPGVASSTYDLENIATVDITCEQPNYGFVAATQYWVQVSTDGEFTDETPYLATSYFTRDIQISAKDLAVELCGILGITTESDLPEEDIPLWFRLKAQITDAPTTVYFSNSIKLEKVKCYYALEGVQLPTTSYLIGPNGWSWDTDAADMIPVNMGDGGVTPSDKFWTIRYLTAGSGFKFNTNAAWDGNEFGYGAVVVDECDAGNVVENGMGNLDVEVSGWYIISLKYEVNGNDIEPHLEILEPKVYVIGPANGGTWKSDAAWVFDVIDDPDAEYPFVSPTVIASTSLRLCINPDSWVSTIDWWKTEFIIDSNKDIIYRGNGGDFAETYSNSAGSVMLNFVTGKGKVE
ncbi:MAG: SusF/SusE family outer membrane protein [Bacteroidales bacterium]